MNILDELAIIYKSSVDKLLVYFLNQFLGCVSTTNQLNHIRASSHKSNLGDFDSKGFDLRDYDLRDFNGDFGM